MRMRINDLQPEDESLIKQATELLFVSFREHWPEAWPDLDAAEQEVRESLMHDRISRVALGESGTVLGWISGIRQYDGNVWELHPLAVRPDARGRGVGRALVEDLETQARERGGLTLWLGTDDEDGMTTLSGVNLYPDIPGRIANIKNLKRHPYEFYQKLGFVIVGVMPDANGPGKPDIFMAKSLT
ncbi:MAG TPA: GNAT family N-acetyltransferase [Pyrinomonadaceae bacterium]|nr:GNAT family N-acetyltransferase [Pyrinomonadaceae bacterium]